MGDISEHFNHAERKCPCADCGGWEIDEPELIKRIELARKLYGKQITVTSWCRCQKHNERIGSVDSSTHIQGKAIDIAAVTSRERFELLNALFGAGFNRIGMGNHFIHADIDETKPQQVVWNYYEV